MFSWSRSICFRICAGSGSGSDMIASKGEGALSCWGTRKSKDMSIALSIVWTTCPDDVVYKWMDGAIEVIDGAREKEDGAMDTWERFADVGGGWRNEMVILALTSSMSALRTRIKCSKCKLSFQS